MASTPASSSRNEARYQSDPIEQAMTQWHTERADLDPSPIAVFGRIARISALQRRVQNRAHEPFNLTYAAFDMLANLRRSGSPHRKTASDLAQSSLISTGGITFRMDGLETDGLIRRVRDPDDRRLVYAELTDLGLKLIDEAIDAHFETEHRMLEGLTEREQHQLAKLLIKLEASITATEVEDS